MGKKKKGSDDIWGDDLDFGENFDFEESDDFFDEGEGGKKKKKRKKLKPMSYGRIARVCIFALLSTCVMAFFGYVIYTNYVTYPQKERYDNTLTGIYCLEQWDMAMSNLESPFEDSYLNDEVVYANGDTDKVAFYKKMLSTVEYCPYPVNQKNVFGNDWIDRETGNTIQVDSTVGYNEKVGMKVIDYDAIDFTKYKDQIKSLMIENELEFGDVNYEHRLVDVFVDFMLWLPENEIPIKVIDRVPNLSLEPCEPFNSYGVRVDNKFVVTVDEDIYLDKLLFSSYWFYDCLDRFSEVASNRTSLKEYKDYTNWNKLSDVEKETSKRPERFNYKECCAKQWCGAYYLENEYAVVDASGNVVQGGIRAEVGDGSINNPLGMFTDAVTSVYFSERDELGNIISYEAYPIRVELTGYGYSQDAIDYFESKDIRNRGIVLASDVQYCYMTFNVTNLSDKELTINENMGLCDINGNMQARTGTIYGLQGSVTLKPDETGVIETWQSSTSLWKKYVVWGNDFDRREDLVFFRLLAGDLENEDEFKGVTVNTSRVGAFSEEQSTESTENTENSESTESTESNVSN